VWTVTGPAIFRGPAGLVVVAHVVGAGRPARRRASKGAPAVTTTLGSFLNTVPPARLTCARVLTSGWAFEAVRPRRDRAGHSARHGPPRVSRCGGVRALRRRRARPRRGGRRTPLPSSKEGARSNTMAARGRASHPRRRVGRGKAVRGPALAPGGPLGPVHSCTTPRSTRQAASPSPQGLSVAGKLGTTTRTETQTSDVPCTADVAPPRANGTEPMRVTCERSNACLRAGLRKQIAQ